MRRIFTARVEAAASRLFGDSCLTGVFFMVLSSSKRLLPRVTELRSKPRAGGAMPQQTLALRVFVEEAMAADRVSCHRRHAARDSDVSCREHPHSRAGARMDRCRRAPRSCKASPATSLRPHGTRPRTTTAPQPRTSRSLKTPTARSITELPLNGTRPVSSSYAQIPRPQIGTPVDRPRVAHLIGGDVRR